MICVWVAVAMLGLFLLFTGIGVALVLVIRGGDKE